MGKKISITVLILILTFSCQSFSTFTKYSSAFAAQSGLISAEQANALTETAKAGEKVTEDITPEQEYYIGRAVGAAVLSQYKVYENDAATLYLNRIGKSLSLFSDRPETFGGYHFLILDSDEINAFAAPSGHIFISRGLLKLTNNEDDLAAILAHEISHVVLKHGLSAIKKSRVTGFLTILGTNALKELGSQEVAELTSVFEDSISDITATLINNGYSREFENEADEMAISILTKTGYDKYSLNRVLVSMEPELTTGGADFSKTHPAPEQRIEKIEKNTNVIGSGEALPGSERYNTAIRGI